MSLRLIDLPSPNHNERLHPVDMLVLHYTGMVDGPAAIERLRDPASNVSAHYVVEEDGRIFKLVSEDRRAWHAGRSRWQGDEDLNSRSIGVEIVNGGHEFGLPPYPDAQMDAVIELCRDILLRWPIPPVRIVAHSDIAPDRKDDPGERFAWDRLAGAGIGIWPDFEKVDKPAEGFAPGDVNANVARLRSRLAGVGYNLASGERYDADLEAVIRAFQRRWRPSAVTGVADAETFARIKAVAEAYAKSEFDGVSV